MFGMGPWELVLIFAILLLLFGGKKLPSIASGLGGAIKNFKTAMNEEDSNADKKLNQAEIDIDRNDSKTINIK